MLADTTTPAGSVRAIFEPNKVPYITRDLQITKDEFVCDNNVRIYAPVSITKTPPTRALCL
jgi:hypothetical protein